MRILYISSRESLYDADPTCRYEVESRFLNRVTCVLVLNNLMVVVSPQGGKYGHRH